ncbi:hypothetical protein RhiirA1_470441 [Rhizophagus irregularis]|uniref:F-box domain-containing protein n=1 Tax=Rhizophagus irregularis TaxID=588596 RepID=A0A2N0R656_9GLOM|nr:hypothetical protein RhiirA1_470441 [Rhizophagus irregularis]
MACSKIFSGELPELLSDIMQYFRNDFSTLHSCILVNRLWCHLAIPLLWENPFSIISHKNYYNIEYHEIRFIENYLINLNDNDKIKLNEFGINHLTPSNTLFNYPGFIQHLDAHLIGDCIENWVAAVKKNEQCLLLFLKNTQNLDFIKFFHKLLIKIFIENKANLYAFDITYHHKYFDINSESVLQSSNFIYNIKILYLDINAPLLKFLSSNCNSISSLHISNFVKYKDSTAIEYLSQLIKSQKNLKKICFIDEIPPILLNFNCSNTLNTIIFCDIDFKDINNLNEVFEELNVLESIHIINCYSLGSNFIQQIINSIKPFKLKSLIIDEIFESIDLLLQKSGDYLENFGLSFEPNTFYYGVLDSQFLESKSKILKLITRYCTKIKFFKLTEFSNQNIYLTFNLIENIKQNLNYLTIDTNYDFGSGLDTELGSIILQNLGQILPFKLEYLDLTLVMNTTDFEIFLINSQNTFIEKLLLSNKMDRKREKVGQDNMLSNIKEYIMKMKRVKYFAFKNHFFTDAYGHKELFYLKDEVKEFKLYSIVIQNYNDLKIKFFEFISD